VDVQDIVKNLAKYRGIHPDEALTPQEAEAVRPLLGRAVSYKVSQVPVMAEGGGDRPTVADAFQSLQQQPQRRAPQARQPVQPPPPPQVNEAVSNLLPPGHPDPREAVSYLRRTGEQILAASGGRGAGPMLAKQRFDRADEIEKIAFGAPAGFERAAGSVRPIAGGPEDPAYISAKADAGLKPVPLPPGSQLVNPKTGEPLFQNNSGLIDDDTAEAMARQAEGGDTSVFTNLGRGAQGAENVLKVRQKIAQHNRERGETGAEQAQRNAEYFGVKAGQRTLGNKSANIELAATEFKRVLPVVQEASKEVSRTNYPDLNKIIQMFEEKTGDPNIVKFGGGVNTLVNLYARAISPTGNPTVSDKDHARLILNRAWSQGQFDAAVGMMSQEIDAALSSPETVRDAMRQRFLGGQGGQKPAGEERPPAKPPIGVPSPADIDAEMRRRGLLK
jgi:hypothetical protein